MKKAISVLLFLCIFCSVGIPVPAEEGIEAVIQDTADFLLRTVPEPQVGSVGGEWAVLGLARSGLTVPETYFSDYYSRLERYLSDADGVLHERKYTEYSRVILALTAIGKNPETVGAYNLLLHLGDYEKTVWQGMNGPIWALIALDSGNYAIPQNTHAETQATREIYLERLLAAEMAGGGWALSAAGTEAEIDITAMALIALSPYRKDEKIAAAVERGLAVLSSLQQDDGGFSGYQSKNAESAAQVLTAISSLGISYRDPRFVKQGNTLVDYLLQFYTEGQGFSHIADKEASDLMATEQCFYALVAADRLEKQKNALFDMKDRLSLEQGETSVGLPGKHPQVIQKEILYPDKTFADIAGHSNRQAIEALAARGIISGMTPESFCPDHTMTRAEFATIVVKALGISTEAASVFEDVAQEDWFFPYVSTAYAYGIVNGISETAFHPGGTITREEAAAMTARAAKLCGIETEMELFAAKNILAAFTDYITVSDWAVQSLAFCYDRGLLDDGAIDIHPQKAVLRAEIAQMLYHMLERAEFL